MNNTENIPEAAPVELTVTELSVTKDQVIEALKTVEDPELFLDIWFLGLIYTIDIEDFDGSIAENQAEKQGNKRVKIDMTFTSPMCPAGPLLIDKVKTAVGAIAGVSEVKVTIVFNPPWMPSEEVKALVGML